MHENHIRGSGFSPQSGNSDLQPLSVSELNGKARRLLEMSFNNVRVEGELSGLARPSSGHWYFTLKDASSQIRCAMFRHKNQALKFLPSEGMQLLIRGRVSLYEGRGDYQMIVEHMDHAGSGALQKAFESLKKKLADEGLFDTQRKKALPKHPKHIAVVTSPTGAAVRDIIAVLKRRHPGIPITVIPAAVQGNDAKEQLTSAIQLAGKSPDFDVLIVGRGGGSMEDLWSFNEESVARAISECPIPVVSAVGHEVDFTIADFVADYRAPTPSAAAEVLSPNRQELSEQVQLLYRKISTLTQHRLELARYQLSGLGKQLRHPGDRLRENSQRLDDLDIRLNQAMSLSMAQSRSTLNSFKNALFQRSPERKIAENNIRSAHLSDRLNQLMGNFLEKEQLKLQNLSSQLNTVSPLATLSRGYAIIQKENQVIQSASQLQSGDRVTARLGEGSVICEVKSAQLV